MSETDIYRQYRKTLLSPGRVRELSQLRPARAVIDTTLCWLIIFLTWAFVAWQPTWWAVLVSIPIVGTRAYALMIIAHDGLHRRLFPGVRANDLFNDLFIVGSFGAITRINNQNHLAHHNHLATEDDPDRHKYTCINKDTGLKLLGYLIGAQVFISIWNVIGPGDKNKRSNSASRSRTLRDLLILIGWQLFLWITLTTLIGWWAVPVLWYMPFFVFALLGDNFRTFAEHTQPEPDAQGDTHRLITYDSNIIERMFFSPMNMNYHTAHHLWTSIPYYNLPRADAEIRHQPAAAGLEWRKSYVGFLLRYWLALPMENCRSESQVQP
jgi:fatty acid desaturase